MGKRRFFDFNLKYLSDLASKEESFVTVQRSQYHFVLHPWHFNNFSQSIRDHLNKGISSYDEKLDGILLGYKNLKLMSDVGRIHGDACFVHYDIAADFFIFKPEIGRCLTGTVLKKSKDHVTCLVYNCFTISIPKPKPEDCGESWVGDDLRCGTEVQIKIERMNLQKMSIKGSILKKLDDKVNRKLVFDESPDRSKTKKNIAKQSKEEPLNTSKDKELLAPDETVNHDSSEEDSSGSDQALNIVCETVPENESRVTSEVDSSSEKEDAEQIEKNNENSSSGISSQQEFTDHTSKVAKVEKKKRRKSTWIQNDDQLQELSNVSTKQQSSGTSDTSSSEKTGKSKGKKSKTGEEPSEKPPHVSESRAEKKQKTKKTAIKTIPNSPSSEESNEIEEIENIEIVNVQEYETDFETGNVNEGDDKSSEVPNIDDSQEDVPLPSPEMDIPTEEHNMKISRNEKMSSSTRSQDDIALDTKSKAKVKKERRRSLFIGNPQDVPLPSPEMDIPIEENTVISRNGQMSSSTWSQDEIAPDTKSKAKVKKERRNSMFIGNPQDVSPEMDIPSKEHTKISSNTKMSSSTWSEDEIAPDTKSKAKVKKKRRNSLFIGNSQDVPIPSAEMDMATTEHMMSSNTWRQEEIAPDTKSNAKVKKEKKSSLFNQHIDSKSDVRKKRKHPETISTSESEDKISPHKSKKLKTSFTKSSKTGAPESSKSVSDFEREDIGKEQLNRNQMQSPEQSPVKMTTEKAMLKSKVKLKSEKHSSDDSSHKKSKKKRVRSPNLEDEKEQILDQLLKVKLKSEKHSSDDSSHKKSKKKRVTSLTLEDEKEQILNQLLKVKKQELEVEEDYTDYANMQIKQEEISLPDLDMDTVLESTKLEDTSLKNSFYSSVEMPEDSSLEKILASPVKLEHGRSPLSPKKKKKVKREINDDI